MRARHLRLAVALAAALTATACQGGPPPMQTLPPITFTDRMPFRLDVAELEIYSEYQQPGRLPNIEHLMPVSPAAAMERWAQDRLRPMGQRGSGSARVVIKDAHVVERPLVTDKSLSGAFKKEQEMRYDAVLQVALEIQDPRHITIADVTATAKRSRTVGEGMTVNDRDKVLYDMTESLARDIDQQMDQLIRAYLGRWLVQR